MIISKNKPTNLKIKLESKSKNMTYLNHQNDMETSVFFKKIEAGLASKKQILAGDKFWMNLIKKVYV